MNKYHEMNYNICQDTDWYHSAALDKELWWKNFKKLLKRIEGKKNGINKHSSTD